MTDRFDRRSILKLGLGCSLAASPVLTPISLAAAPWDARLVVILLRGGLDGLDAVQPYADPAWPSLRRRLRGGPDTGALDLDGFFALHPALAELYPLWAAQDLGFVHAVSTPYRDKRSHFDGQDILEAGTAGKDGGIRDGWLNRLLQTQPGLDVRTAYAIGREEMLLLRGDAPVSNWSPDARLAMSPQTERLMAMVMEDDPLFHTTYAEAELLSEVVTDENNTRQKKRGGHIDIARFAADQLQKDTRIAAFSLNGWDTHRNQNRVLANALKRLSDTVLALKNGLAGAVWGKTAIVAMTEFGRTVRENGTQGTDHGTGGLMILAGGAIRGGKVYGRWPGLGEADLYARRDLLPTRDVRSAAAWLMRDLIGFDATTLEQTIFPGLDMESRMSLVG